MSESEDFQYVRVNVGRLNERGSVTLTEDMLQQLTEHLALSSKEIDNMPNDAFALVKYLEGLPKNVVVDLVEDQEKGAPFVEVERVHRSRVLHHTPKTPHHMFRPPDHIRHQEDDANGRSATWLGSPPISFSPFLLLTCFGLPLELFYDIFYVAVISKISGGSLSSWLGFGEFISLFLPIWWAWAMVTFYATRFDTDDVLHRLLIFVQMFGITGLAVTVESAYDVDAVGFIWSFVLIRVCLIVQYILGTFLHLSLSLQGSHLISRPLVSLCSALFHALNAQVYHVLPLYELCFCDRLWAFHPCPDALQADYLVQQHAHGAHH